MMNEGYGNVQDLRRRMYVKKFFTDHKKIIVKIED